MLKYIKHFITITKHRYYVRKFCFKCGFYKRGLLHDLSKYSFTEFFSSARYFQGTSSPIDAEKREKGYSLAWQHHKGHNPHHWEYWIDNIGTYKNTPIKIPYEYVIEMICDWLGAGIVYSKQKVDFDKPYSEPIEYYNKCKNERIFHPETQALIEFYLDNIRVFSINNFCKRVKNGDYQKVDYTREYLP
jgi:hypothetical protein